MFDDVRLGGFGSSKKVSPPNSLITYCGRGGYVAPEVLAGGYYDHNVDLWSCGVLLFLLIGGFFPFEDSNEDMSRMRTLQGNFDFCGKQWIQVSTDAKEAIASLLVVEAGRRCSAAGMLESLWIQRQDEAHLSEVATNLQQSYARRRSSSFSKDVIHRVIAKGSTSNGTNATMH